MKDETIIRAGGRIGQGEKKGYVDIICQLSLAFMQICQ